MGAASASPGCFTYLFVVCISLMGYIPFGLHGTDFSKDGKKLAYTYNLKEVRIYDLEKKQAGEALYTAPEGWLVDTVNWNEGSGEIYAVSHNFSSVCEAMDEDGGQKKIDRKWKAEIIGVKPGEKPRTIVSRELYCPELAMDTLGEETQDGQPNEKTYNAPYQTGLDKTGISFKPSGWKKGIVYYVEPEELTKRPTSVYKLDLTTGKSEKVFALPENDRTYSCALSPSAELLSCLSLRGNEGEEKISITLRNVAKGKTVFSSDIANEPETEGEGQEDIQMLTLMSGAEAVSAFDEAEGKFFFISYNTAKKTSELKSYDMKTGAVAQLFESYEIGAPLPLPGKKALLINAIGASLADIKPDITKGKVSATEINKDSTFAVVSYDGKIIKKLDLPPLLNPVFQLRPPDVSLSPDSNLVAFTIGFKPADVAAEELMNPGKEQLTYTLPAILNLEKGTFEILVTKAEDNLAAGMFLYNIEALGLALPYFEKYVDAFKADAMMYSEAAFSLLVSYQHLGKKSEADALYKKIYGELLAGEEEPQTAFAIRYMSAAASTSASMFESLSEPALEELPGFGGLLDDAKLGFAVAELKKADEKGSKKAAFIAAVALAASGKDSEALKMFELAAEKMPKETEFGTFNMSFVIGQLKGRGGDCASAVESFTKYLDAPGFHKDQALRARAECYVKLGKKEEAISDYRALLDAAKEALKSTEEFGWGEDSAVIYKEAIEELEQKISEIEKSGQ